MVCCFRYIVQKFYVYVHWKLETLIKNKGKLRQVEARGQTERQTNALVPTYISIHAAQVQTLHSIRCAFIHFVSPDQCPYYTIAANYFIWKQITHLHVRPT